MNSDGENVYIRVIMIYQLSYILQYIFIFSNILYYLEEIYNTYNNLLLMYN